MTNIAIHGAAGRMGRRLVALATEDDALTVTAAVEHAAHADLGKDAGTLAGGDAIGVPLSAELGSGVAQVMIDFSLPIATRSALKLCEQQGVALVIGTTGLTDDDHAAIDVLAKSVAVMQAPNMSLGVNLLFALAAQVAKKLGDDYDIEIVETHHRHKVDAPSGTALGIAQAICDATGKSMKSDLVYDRHELDQPRRRGEIGMHAIRSGDVVGRHTASFGTPGEELQLTHIASTRDVFARGALTAAKWLAGKPAGRYGMADVLGL